jgi:hypothetical protein
MTPSAGVVPPTNRVLQHDGDARASAPRHGAGHDPAHKAGAPTDLPHALRLLAERALHLLDAGATRILLGSECRLAASAGAPSASPDEHALCQRAFRERRLQIDGPRAAAPMLADGSPIGALLAVARAPAFTDAE